MHMTMIQMRELNILQQIKASQWKEVTRHSS